MTNGIIVLIKYKIFQALIKFECAIECGGKF